MTTHYRAPDLLITHDAVAVRVPTWRRMMIRDLRDPHVVVIGAPWPRGRRVYHICATYRGYRVCLLSTADAKRFGQARRALVRAFERERERRERLGVSDPRQDWQATM